ncbi:MAG: type II toxin-antitoxin system Phd/YefM family antitoxin [Euzebyaceae bacterium]|nr:type II toxin-antitoxin system Phd/YefM family antitoxin [Euzebyaceae bacterium]
MAVTSQLHDAKQRFSELVRRAIEEGPQTVTRRGKHAVVVISARQLDRLIAGGGRRFQGLPVQCARPRRA